MDYKKYSLENLENWMHDAMSVGEASPQEIYDVILGVVKENYYIYKQQASQAYELLALLNGNGGWKVEDVLKEREYYDGWDNGIISNRADESNLTCDKDDPSPECQKSWNDFWGAEDEYYPHPDQPVYTEEELNAMCDKAASDSEKEQCREYNLREAEYYDKRAQLDADYQKMKEQVSRNDPNRLKYEEGWVYESPDGGKTITKRKPGSLEKINVEFEQPKKWILPVQQGSIDGVNDYYVEFPNDLLEAANLKEGDQVEWIDREDGSFELRKACPVCPPCENDMFSPE